MIKERARFILHLVEEKVLVGSHFVVVLTVVVTTYLEVSFG